MNRQPLDANFPAFDVVLPDIIEVSKGNDGAQSLLCILEFRLDGDLGEWQVVYLTEEDEDMEVSEHSSHIDEAVDVDEAVGPFGSVPLLGKRMLQKHKGMQLMHPVNRLQSYKKGNLAIVEPSRILLLPWIPCGASRTPMWWFLLTS